MPSKNPPRPRPNRTPAAIGNPGLETRSTIQLSSSELRDRRARSATNNRSRPAFLREASCIVAAAITQSEGQAWKLDAPLLFAAALPHQPEPCRSGGGEIG